MRLTAWVLCGTVVTFALTLGGCSDSGSHKSGVYKGAKDPLIEKERSPEQQEKLAARFNQVQTDR